MLFKIIDQSTLKNYFVEASTKKIAKEKITNKIYKLEKMAIEFELENYNKTEKNDIINSFKKNISEDLLIEKINKTEKKQFKQLKLGLI